MEKLAIRSKQEIELRSLKIELRSQRGHLETSRLSPLVATKKNTRVETGNAKIRNMHQVK